MRTGLSLDLPRHPRTNEPLLPLDHMQKRRLDVLAEMARLEEHHSSACEALEAELAEEHRVARIEAIKHEVSVVDKEWK